MAQVGAEAEKIPPPLVEKAMGPVPEESDEDEVSDTEPAEKVLKQDPESFSIEKNPIAKDETKLEEVIVFDLPNEQSQATPSRSQMSRKQSQGEAIAAMKQEGAFADPILDDSQDRVNALFMGNISGLRDWALEEPEMENNSLQYAERRSQKDGRGSMRQITRGRGKDGEMSNSSKSFHPSGMLNQGIQSRADRKGAHGSQIQHMVHAIGSGDDTATDTPSIADRSVTVSRMSEWLQSKKSDRKKKKPIARDTSESEITSIIATQMLKDALSPRRTKAAKNARPDGSKSARSSRTTRSGPQGKKLTLEDLEPSEGGQQTPGTINV